MPEVTLTERDVHLLLDDAVEVWTDSYHFWETPKTRVVKSLPGSNDVQVIGRVLVEKHPYQQVWLTSFSCTRFHNGRSWQRLPAYRIGDAKSYDDIVDAVQYGAAMLKAFRDSHPYARTVTP
jgi:hypothetical protein